METFSRETLPVLGSKTNIDGKEEEVKEMSLYKRENGEKYLIIKTENQCKEYKYN